MKKTEEVNSNIEEKEEGKIKRFFKKNGRKIGAVAGSILGGLVIAGVACLTHKDSNDDFETEEDSEDDGYELTDKQKDAKHIDEYIFTQLGPDIESFMITDNIDYVEHRESLKYGDTIKDLFVSITTRQNEEQ